MTCLRRLTYLAAALAAMAAAPAADAQQDRAPRGVFVHEGDPPRVELRGMTVPIREFVANPEGPFVRGIFGHDPTLPPEDVEHLEWLTEHSDLILLVDVVGGSPRLNDRGDFIVSDWRARVTRVFKSPDDTWTAGQNVAFTTLGGTMTVAGTVVEAVVPWARPIHVGGRYLVFKEAVPKRAGELGEVAPHLMYEFAGLNAVERVHEVPEGQSDQLEASFQAEIVTRLEELTGAR